MAYVGNQNYQAYVTLSNQTFVTSGATTIYSLNYTVTNANNIALYINNVPQQPSVAYTAAGNTLTLTTATSSSMYAVYLGQGIQTVQPGNSSVGTSQLTTGAVGISNLSATGTPSSTTFLRGDNTWSSAATTGNVLQVVSTTKTDSFNTTSTSLIDITNLTVNITPSSASNKILIFGSIFSNTINGQITIFQLVRNSTNIAIGTVGNTFVGTIANYLSASSDANSVLTNSFNFLDSPSTTSSVTYKIQVRNNSGGATYINNRPANDESFVSTITALEIKG